MSDRRVVFSSIRKSFSEVRIRRRMRALALLLSAGLVVSQVFPTLAENISNAPQSEIETSTVTTLPSGETTTATTDSQNETSASEGLEENSESEAEPTPPPPPPPPHATGSQDMLITMPSSIRVDPRASTVFMPQSSFYSFNTLMACISSATLRFDLGQIGAVDDSEGEGLMLIGDQTNNVIIAGYPTLVNSFINSERGLRIFRTGGSVGAQVAVFRFVDISEPALDEMLCGDGDAGNNRYLQVVPLGLSQNITKAKVGLEKGKKKG